MSSIDKDLNLNSERLSNGLSVDPCLEHDHVVQTSTRSLCISLYPLLEYNKC